MCGCFAFWITGSSLREEFDLPGHEDAIPELPARYNIAPGDGYKMIWQVGICGTKGGFPDGP